MLNSSQLIETLTKVMHQISKIDDKKEIFLIIEKLLIDFSDSNTATLFVYNKEKHQLCSFTNEEETFFHNNEEKSLLGNAFLLKKQNYYNHVISEKYYNIDVDNPHNLKLKAQILMPIVEKDELIAIIRTNRILPNSKPYHKFEMDMLHSLQDFLTKIIVMALSSTKDMDRIIDTKQINTEIEKATHLKDMPVIPKDTMLFLSNIVHDIRTPANALYGFLELIEEYSTDTRIKDFVSNAKESALFINTLTDAILDTNKQEYREDNDTNTITSTIKFFAGIANLFSANMSDKKIEYIIYLDPSLPKEIKIDALKLKRILVNLIGNAYKFTPINKKIFFEINYNKNKSTLDISIEDEGIGIAKDKQEKIFQAFEQAEDDTTQEYGGTGLGLSICSNYVHELKGELKVESQLGKGSKFYFTIPIEIINADMTLNPFVNLNKKITILDDGTHKSDAQNIYAYLISFGLSSHHITIANTFSSQSTHIFCFQNQLSDSLMREIKEKQIKLLIIEESILSLSQDERYKNETIMSLNTYYADAINDFTYFKPRHKILIADDNKINVMLLESMLEVEYVTIESVVDGELALAKLYAAQEKNEPFDIVFIDQHMPYLSGSEVIKRYKSSEQEYQSKPIYAISITGDPYLSQDDKSLFDLHIPKPFNKQIVRDAIIQLK